MTRKTKGLSDVTITISTRITVDQKIRLEDLAIKTGKAMSTHIREALDLLFDKYGIESTPLVEA